MRNPHASILASNSGGDVRLTAARYHSGINILDVPSVPHPDPVSVNCKTACTRLFITAKYAAVWVPMGSVVVFFFF
jgi:hypothetical protein